MSRWRIVVMLLLIAAPMLILAGLGSYFVWNKGWGLYFWWPMALLMTAGYVLGWYWQRQRRLVHPAEFTPPMHYSERDREAMKLVETRAHEVASLSGDKLGDWRFYVDTAHEMAVQLASFYNPGAADPVASLTIPEILAVVELAAHDLNQTVNDYLPAGHLLTVQNWRQARQATEWYQTANQVYWLVSAIFNPVNTGLRYATSQMGMSRPWQLLQQNLYAAFYTLYVREVGKYLIDVYTGRLRGGAQRYREVLRGENTTSSLIRPNGQGAPPPPAIAEEAERVKQVTLLVLGQVKAGKSSFINALLGERRAATDVLPATNSVSRYELQPKDIQTRLVLLDSAGYGHTGPKEDELRGTEEAARHADLLVLVMHAMNPARQADLDMLKRLREWYARHPELRMPPVLGVMTHVDLLSPALEWAPPYHWPEPTRPKEHSIKEAWEAVREQLGPYLVGVVPVCTANGKVYGIEEWFLPTLAELMDEAHAVALLRCLRAEADTGKVKKVFHQLVTAGREAARLAWGPNVPTPQR
jgi:predicted GTPase